MQKVPLISVKRPYNILRSTTHVTDIYANTSRPVDSTSIGLAEDSFRRRPTHVCASTQRAPGGWGRS